MSLGDLFYSYYGDAFYVLLQLFALAFRNYRVIFATARLRLCVPTSAF